MGIDRRIHTLIDRCFDGRIDGRSSKRSGMHPARRAAAQSAIGIPT